MSSPEITVLQTQVAELQEEMTDMKTSVSSLKTLPPRMTALEAQQRAADARFEHIDRVVMSIQLGMQKLEKSFAGIIEQHAADTAKLDVIHSMQIRMLDLMQKK